MTAAGAGGVVVEAINTATINALSMGGAAAANAGSGAGSQNTIDIGISAEIAGAAAPGGRTIISATGGPVRVEARDTSSIKADAGGVSVALALGKKPNETNLTGAIAASVAINRITNTVSALVNRADITAGTAGGDISVLATSNATISALTLSGSAAIQQVNNNGQGDSLSLTLAGAGAGSGNSLDDTVTAIVTDSTLAAGGNVLVKAQRPAAADGSPTIKARGLRRHLRARPRYAGHADSLYRRGGVGERHRPQRRRPGPRRGRALDRRRRRHGHRERRVRPVDLRHRRGRHGGGLRARGQRNRGDDRAGRRRHAQLDRLHSRRARHRLDHLCRQ